MTLTFTGENHSLCERIPTGILSSRYFLMSRSLSIVGPHVVQTVAVSADIDRPARRAFTRDFTTALRRVGLFACSSSSSICSISSWRNSLSLTSRSISRRISRSASCTSGSPPNVSDNVLPGEFIILTSVLTIFLAASYISSSIYTFLSLIQSQLPVSMKCSKCTTHSHALIATSATVAFALSKRGYARHKLPSGIT